MGNLLEILLIVFLTVLNGLFSMSETAIVSVRRARLQQRADAGDERAAAALELVRRPDRFLSTVQIGITLIGIVAGAFGGANLSADLGKWLARMGVPVNLSQTLGFILVVAFITYLSLVVGELVPKSLALNNAEGVATQIAKPMALLSRFASPVVGFLSLSTRGILRILGVREAEETPVTEDEINIYIAQGVHAGAFVEEERDIVERVFRTADRRVNGLMTPRREIMFLDAEDSWEENQKKIAQTPYAAFPVCEGGLDNLLGLVSLKRIWLASAGGAPVDLRAITDSPMYVLETTRALAMLETFKRSVGKHVALVVDEYGNVVGLVTLHDVLEGIVGELPSAEEVREQNLAATRRADGSWLLDGMLPVDEMLHLLSIKETPEDNSEYTTLGGFVMARLGRIPAPAERFTWENHEFEVMDMDGNRVDRVLVTPPTVAAAAAPAPPR